MPRPVMRTLLPFLRCFTTRPMKSSRQPVASFLVMPVFSASSAATFDSGTVGADGLVAVAMMRGPLGFLWPFEAVIHRLKRARSVSRPRLTPTFPTAVNTWQCDENDHLNVQFYTEFGHEASAHLLAELGLGPRAQRAAGLEVRAASDHIRYLREFREVDPVQVLSAPVEVGDNHLLAYHEIRNPSDGTVAATMRRRIVCDRPWPDTFRARADAAIVALPDNARPRSVGKLDLPDLALGDAVR